MSAAPNTNGGMPQDDVPMSDYDHFVPMSTTDAEWTCWTLQAGDTVLGSVLMPASASKAEAWLKFRLKRKWEGAFWGAVESGDANSLRRVVGEGDDRSEP